MSDETIKKNRIDGESAIVMFKLVSSDWVIGIVDSSSFKLFEQNGKNLDVCYPVIVCMDEDGDFKLYDGIPFGNKDKFPFFRLRNHPIGECLPSEEISKDYIEFIKSIYEELQDEDVSTKSKSDVVDLNEFRKK